MLRLAHWPPLPHSAEFDNFTAILRITGFNVFMLRLGAQVASFPRCNGVTTIFSFGFMQEDF